MEYVVWTCLGRGGHFICLDFSVLWLRTRLVNSTLKRPLVQISWSRPHGERKCELTMSRLLLLIGSFNLGFVICKGNWVKRHTWPRTWSQAGNLLYFSAQTSPTGEDKVLVSPGTVSYWGSCLEIFILVLFITQNNLERAIMCTDWRWVNKLWFSPTIEKFCSY